MSGNKGNNGNNKNVPNGYVTLCFDDGWKSIYENCFAILEQVGIKGTFYVVTGYLDNSQFPAYMNIKQLLELSRKGHEIGCHTVSHRHLPQEPDSLVESEVILSRRYILNLGIPVETFAYPYGEYDDRIIDIVQKAGFLAARGTERGFNDTLSERFLLKVQAVKAITRVSEVISWLNQALMEGKWLILMFHQIDYEGREWSTQPEILKAITDHIQDNNIETVTVASGAKKVLVN